jgi:hypothetical protein
MKTCCSCHKELSLDSFYKNTSSCKLCFNIYHQARKQSLQGKFSTYKSCAKQRGIAWELSLEQFQSFWQAPCNYCGGEIATIGIDRIDSSIGYQSDNCVSCCSVCNKIKNDFDLTFLNDHLYRMLKHQNLI